MTEQFTRRDNGAVYYTSPLFDSFNIPHAFFTRHGGVSASPFDTLNFSAGLGEVKDSSENILINHRIGASVFGLDENCVCRTYQTHSDTVAVVDRSHRGTGTTLPPFNFDVDGLVTREEDVILSVRSADCVPILLYDVKNDICAAVHSGWRGTEKNISAVAIGHMVTLGSDISDIIAAIGPCAGVCCYEVGSELFDIFTAIDKKYAEFFLPKSNGKYNLDLTGLNNLRLVQSGISAEHISACNICTCCNTADFFSHRVMGNNRGTMASFIMKRR